MTVDVSPFRARGALPSPVSKSAAHRVLILAALSGGECAVRFDGTNDDIDATLGCLAALGAVFERTCEGVAFQRAAFPAPSPELDCGESGSTLRFLLPVAAALGGGAFRGRGRLPERPLDDLLDVLSAHGAVFTGRRLPFKVSGPLRGGEFSLPGHVSSQYLTGLLLASPLMEEDTVIRLTSPLQSAAYVDMTLEALRLFGVRAGKGPSLYRVPGGQRLRPSRGPLCVEGDWSGAAFPLALGALGGDVSVRGLSKESLQGDRAMAGLLSDMGASVRWEGDVLRVRGGDLTALDADVSAIPDLVPPLAAVLMHARGVSRLYNAGRLRLKESDRLETVRSMVVSLGGCARIEDDSLVITGKPHCPGGTVSGAGDHRIVMAAAVAAAACDGPSRITDPEAVRKSYPAFPSHYQTLGGIWNVLNVR